MVKIQVRQANDATANLNNVVLDEGELGFTFDTALLKVGDGTTPWIDLDLIRPKWVGAGVRPEDMFPAHDFGVTDDSAELQACQDFLAALGSGIMLLTSPVYRAHFKIKTGVLTTSTAEAYKWAGGNAPVRIIPPVGWAGGWLVDTDAGAVQRAGVCGITISGGMTSTADPDTGGLRIQQGVWCAVEGVTVAGTSLGCIKLTGTAMVVRHNGVQNFWQWRDVAPTSYEGALWLNGTDYFIEGNQSNGGHPVLDPLDSTDITTLYKAANYWTLLTSVIVGGNGEFAQCGNRLNLHQSVTYGLRGDTNPGPAFHFTQSSFNGASGGSRHVGLKMLGNCSAPNADGVLDGMYVDEVATDFDGIMLAPNWQGGTMAPRYGINDRANFTGFSLYARQRSINRYRNVRFIHNVVAPAFTQDVFTRATPNYASFEGDELGAGNPAYRGAARFSAGKTFADTNNVPPRQTFSDGTNWRLVSDGSVCGNVFAPRTVYFTTGVIDWDPFTAYSTLGLVYKQRHGRPRVLELTTTAAGAAAGQCTAVVKTANAGAVVPNVSYQVALFANGPAGKSGVTGEVLVQWYTNVGGFISATTAIAATAITAGEAANPTILCSVALANSPATAAFATISFAGRATGLAAGDKFVISGMSLFRSGVPALTEPLET